MVARVSDRLTQLRELLANATPGPWGVERDGMEPSSWVTPHGAFSHHDPDNELIAAAVNALPALLDIAEAAQRTASFDLRAAKYATAHYHGYRLIEIPTAEELATALDTLRDALARLNQPEDR